MISLVLSQPQGAVLTKIPKRKMPAAGATNARLRRSCGSILFAVGADSVAAAGGIDVVAGCLVFHQRQPITPTSATIAGNVRPKFRHQKSITEVEKAGSL